MHRRLAVRGLVQGVGFRPWIWQQATALGLVGWVRNTGYGVEIELHGDPALLDALQARIWEIPPPARVDQVEVIGAAEPAEASAAIVQTPPATRPGSFEIRDSVVGTASRATAVGADLAVCPRCLSELFDPGNRRWRHAFTHCPQCGPRYTVIQRLPFDRAHTSMGRFAMCEACAREHVDPANRRFHHQTTACPACGPRLWLHDRATGEVSEEDPIAAALARLQRGDIVAIKGLGGFHLVCDALQPAAVRKLRERKGRQAKPLAVMAANTASLAPWASLTPHDMRWLQSPQRPIVLLRQSTRAQAAMPEVSDGLAWLGVMLPYTPIHFLLWHEAAGRPAGTDWLQQPQDMVLVMTSGNASGDPLVADNDAALHDLDALADAWLVHDRDILARNDDSVLRVRPDGSACFLRRGRGHAPSPSALPLPVSYRGEVSAAPSVLAMGAMLKATVCITQGDRAMVSPHVGDLDSPATREVYAALAERWPAWLDTQPDAVACDLHPDFFSTQMAAQLAQSLPDRHGSTQPLPLIQVQHHHAHVAALQAEHGVRTPVIGLALDGVGLGTDGVAWGGELLWGDAARWSRLGHLTPIRLAGGDVAAREPWRMAAACLHLLGRGNEAPARLGQYHSDAGVRVLMTMLDKGLNSPWATGAGRWFDVAAGILGRGERQAFEAEAAIALEQAATAWLQDHPVDPDPADTPIQADGTLDLLPLMARLWTLADALPEPLWPGAARFHVALADGLARWAWGAALAHDCSTVVLGGGCFYNKLLVARLHEGLARMAHEQGLPAPRILQAQALSCGDAGLALGQAWAVAHAASLDADHLAPLPTPHASKGHA
jgi:hydrogenase maturation protein HypF